MNSSDDTYEISIPVYKTDFTYPKYTCKWIKTNEDGSTSIEKDGCSVISVEENTIRCACIHLTEFTVGVTSETNPVAYSSAYDDSTNGQKIISIMMIIILVLVQL